MSKEYNHAVADVHELFAIVDLIREMPTGVSACLIVENVPVAARRNLHEALITWETRNSESVA